MQKNNLNCRVRPKKSKSIGKPYYKTDNLLQRQFNASQPMEVLITDITYLPFSNSMLYLSSILDVYNGEIVAYKIDNNQGQSLVNDTLNQLDIPEGVYYIVIKAVFTHPILTINYTKKRALSEVCPEKEHQLITSRLKVSITH